MRSRGAAQFLGGKGYKQVYNLSGGLRAWQGREVSGSMHQGMSLISQDASAIDLLHLAYGLEHGLGDFYRAMARRSKDDLEAVFTQLARVEDRHQLRLEEAYVNLGQNKEALFQNAEKDLMEGGLDADEFLVRNRPRLQNPAHVLETAMALETQALDLYLRLAHQVNEERAKALLFEVADEEKAHLEALARKLDTLHGKT